MYFQIKKEPRMAYVHKIFNGQRDHEKEKKYSFQYIYFPREQKNFFFFELGQHYICSTQPFSIRHDHPLCLSLGNMLLQTAN